MKRFLTMIAAALLAAVSTVPAQAVPVPVSITYTLPTQSCVYVNGVVTTQCGPLTGADALTGVEVYFSLSPIADDATLTPVTTLAPAAQTYASTFQAGSGDKVYVRLKAKTASARSVFSNQVFKDVTITTVPNAPVLVSILINAG